MGRSSASDVTVAGASRETAAPSTITVTVHHAEDGTLPPLQREWKQCLAGVPEDQQFLTYEWYGAWTAVYTAPRMREDRRWTGRCRVLVARDTDGRAVGILPLALRLEKGARWWSLAGCQSPLRGFPCHARHVEAVCSAFAVALMNMLGWREILRLGPYGASSPERAALLRELERRSGTLLKFDLYRRIVVRSIPRTREDLRRHIQAHSSFRRVAGYERRMHREGSARFVHYRDPTGPRLKRLIDECRAVEEASWLTRSSWPNFTFARGQEARFWPLVSATSLVPNGQFDCWIAYFNEAPVALRFAVTCGSMRYAIANQYDERYPQYGLGWVLYLKDLEDCVARGVRCIDMAMGNADYKRRWGGEDDVTEMEVLMLPPRWHGRILARLAALPPVYRRLAARMPRL
jgi:CelD/BcsL family acetyltransferase involved in cellulose biosynthesis